MERLISWPLVEERLRRFPAIARAFPLALLRQHTGTEPYFCHYMSLRLGTWHGEDAFKRLDELLCCAEQLPGWAGEQALLTSPDYGVFWALVWQLQVAEHLTNTAGDVRCGNPGPDFSAVVDDTTIFVECYCYQKSFGIASYLEDVLAKVGTDIKLDHDYFMPFALPRNRDTSAFLDSTLAPFLDQDKIEAWRMQAREKWPVMLARPASSLVIRLDGDDLDQHDPTVVEQRSGEPYEYISVFVREAVSAKRNSNDLSSHRPNLVAANYLLSVETHMALHLREFNTCPVLGSNLDALSMSLVGINQRIARPDLILLPSKPPLHPALKVIGLPIEESGLKLLGVNASIE